MYKYLIAEKKIYRISLKKKSENRFDLKEERLEGSHWSQPVEIKMYGENMTLEEAMKRIYGYPFYFSSEKEAKRSLKYA